MVSLPCLEELIHILPAACTLLFSDPLKLLLIGDVMKTQNRLQHLMEKGSCLHVVKAIFLLAVTVNPFYPCDQFKAQSYAGPAVHAPLLCREMGKGVLVPVFDVLREGEAFLEELLKGTGQRDDVKE